MTTGPQQVAEATLRQTIREQGDTLTRAQESIASLQLAIEDKGWKRIGNQYEADGLSLESLQLVSEDLRGWIVGGGIMKRIIELRGTYVYGDEVGFKGLTLAAKKAFTSQNNIDKIFSVTALQEINRAHGTDGNVVFLVNTKTFDAIRVPFEELEDPFIDSDDPERIWYVRRSYTRVTAANPQGVKVDEFYPTATLPSTQASKTSVNLGAGPNIPVNRNFVAVLWKVNGQTGWPLGIPDLLPSLQWAEKYTGYLKNQDRFAEALAAIAWQYKSQNSDQAKKMAATISNRDVAATSTASAGMDAVPMRGNSDVSFENGAPLAGQAAAAAEVPIEAVLASSMVSAGGNLDPDLVRVIGARRQSATAFFKALGRVMGAPDLEVIWPDVTTETPFREAQMAISAYATGMFSPDEIRPTVAERLRIKIADNSHAPEGALIPNNVETLKLTAQFAAKSSPAADPTDPADGDLTNKQGKDALGVGKLSDDDNTARDKGETGN
jgi:hypothetical protein